MKKNKFLIFWKQKIVRQPDKWTWIIMSFWTLVFLINYLLILFVAKRTWVDSQSITAILILCVVGLATVIRLGLFNIYTRAFKNYQINRENKILKENDMELKNKIEMKDIVENKKNKSLIPHIYGLICSLILLITSLPFI